ncbi:hypothetical protein ACLOJK_040676 [Asimina triloba]
MGWLDGGAWEEEADGGVWEEEADGGALVCREEEGRVVAATANGWPEKTVTSSNLLDLPLPLLAVTYRAVRGRRQRRRRRGGFVGREWGR